MTAVNVLVLVHGMTPDALPASPFTQYEAFWQQLCLRRPGLKQAIAKRVGVQWGHEMPALTPEVRATALPWGYRIPPNPALLRPDELLTDAQLNIGGRVNYNEVRTDPSPNNSVITSLFGTEVGVPGVRQLLFVLRENIFLRGFGDAIYYCSSEGEEDIRRVVYEQILRQVDEYASADEVRLHLVGHSLGVTVAHDMLYGLFAPDHVPDFVADEQGTPLGRALFEKWRSKAQRGELRLGSLVTMASQLPLFIMRKRSLVKTLYENGLLDPAVIGISTTDTRTRWVNFYDVDDILGYPTRRLYEVCPALVEVQVDIADLPDRAHIGYWADAKVIERAAELIANNCA